jgi:structure-specific endonuclease subunit SLX1
LEIGYADQKSYVEKGREVVEFEREGRCTLCREDLEHGAGMYTICPNAGCESVTHLTCLGKHFVEGEDSVVPIKGNCPSCNAELLWVDVVKELTLRMRGQNEVEKLLKVKRARKGGTASQATVETFDDDLSDEDILSDITEELERLQEFSPIGSKEKGDDWQDIDDSDSDTRSFTSTTLRTEKALSNETKVGTLRTVVEDSEWEDALVVD